jgi:hypothetical protein
MNDLGQLQREFSSCLSALYAKILADGFEFTLGEGYRTPEQAEINALRLIDRKSVASLLGEKFPSLALAISNSTSAGIKNSVHRDRLAQDLNLFKGGIWLTHSTDYAPFGAWWVKQHPQARYGGDFSDFDHFSFEYNGVR